MFYYEVNETWALFRPLNTPIWAQLSWPCLREQMVHLKIAVETHVVVVVVVHEIEPGMAVVGALLEKLEKKVVNSALVLLYDLYLKMMMMLLPLLQLLLVDCC